MRSYIDGSGHLPPSEEEALNAAAEVYMAVMLAAARRGCDPDYIATAEDADIAGAAVSAAIQGILMTEAGRLLPNIVAVGFTLGATLASAAVKGDAPHLPQALEAVASGFMNALRAKAQSAPINNPQGSA